MSLGEVFLPAQARDVGGRFLRGNGRVGRGGLARGPSRGGGAAISDPAADREADLTLGRPGKSSPLRRLSTDGAEGLCWVQALALGETLEGSKGETGNRGFSTPAGLHPTPSLPPPREAEGGAGKA